MNKLTAILAAILISTPAIATIDTVTQAPFLVDSETELSSVPCVTYTQVYAKDTNKNYINVNSCPTQFVTPTWLQIIPTTTTRSFNNTVSHTIVTTAAAANGFQVSSTRDAVVSYSATITTTSTLSGSSTGHIVLEIASTNSSSAGSWQEISHVSSGQNNTLIVGVTLNQTGGGALNGVVPAGYYARLRSVNDAGTPTYTYNSGQEVLE